MFSVLSVVIGLERLTQLTCVQLHRYGSQTHQNEYDFIYSFNLEKMKKLAKLFLDTGKKRKATLQDNF